MGGGFCRTYPRYLFAVAAQANTGRRPVEAGVLPCSEDICDSWPVPTSTPTCDSFFVASDGEIVQRLTILRGYIYDNQPEGRVESRLPGTAG